MTNSKGDAREAGPRLAFPSETFAVEVHEGDSAQKCRLGWGRVRAAKARAQGGAQPGSAPAAPAAMRCPARLCSRCSRCHAVPSQALLPLFPLPC
ncbi:unnamed protein product, partial [Coccothraustes coccothraustes]